MKILHIIDSEGLYGAEILLLNLMEAQVELGLKLVLFCVGELGTGLKKGDRYLMPDVRENHM